MSGVVPHVDDPAIGPDATLLRRLHPSWVVPDGGGRLKLASNAFQDVTGDDGTFAMSVFVEERLVELGLTELDVLRGHAGYGLAAFPAAAARSRGLIVYFAPSPREPILGDAHAHVLGKKTGSIQKTLVGSAIVRIWPSIN